MMNGRPRREIADGKFLGHVGNERDLLDTFRANLGGDRLDRHRTIERLTAGHRNGVIEQDLVGDIGASGDRLPDRHRTGMIPGALAEILEDVPPAGKKRGRHPVHALPTHLDQRGCLAVHPRCHDVAPDARKRLRTCRHLGRDVVRAAGTKIGRARRALHAERDRCRGNKTRRALHEALPGENAFEPLGDDGCELAR